MLNRADATIVITAEYNHSIPGVLKRDRQRLRLTRDSQQPMGSVGFSSALVGGVRAIEHLAQRAIEAELVPLQNAVVVPFVDETFGQNGIRRIPMTEISLQSLLEDLTWWTAVLKRARAQGELRPATARPQAAAAPPPLPAGIRLTLDEACRVVDGRTLVGGVPGRAMRLSRRGWAALEALTRGDELPVNARALGRRLIDAGLAHPVVDQEASAGDVTIVIPVLDRPAELERCLKALGAESPVIVVDDGSRDAQAIEAAAVRHGAKLMRREQTGGPALARNTALPAIASDLVAFVDSDCVPSRDWLKALIGHFEDPLVAAVAPRIRPRSRPRVSATSRYLSGRSPLDMGPTPAGVNPRGAVPYVPSAALVLRRCSLPGGFDPDLRYGEDVDLIWRVRRAGGRLRYDPSVVVEHEEPDTLLGLVRRRFRYGTSAAGLARRHHPDPTPAVLRPSTMLACLLLWHGKRWPVGILAVDQSLRLAQASPQVGLTALAGIQRFSAATWQQTLVISWYANTFGAPLLLIALNRRRRLKLLGLLFAGPAHDWIRSDRDIDALRWMALRILDETAYGAGVWLGCLKQRTLRPLIPQVGARRRPRRAVCA